MGHHRVYMYCMTQVAILSSANVDIQEGEVVIYLSRHGELDVVYEQGV